MTTASWWRDPGFTIHLIRRVWWRSSAIGPPPGEWEFEIDGRSYTMPEGCDVTPRVGDFVMIYATSKITERGMIVNGTVIYYRTAREDRERNRDFWLAQIGTDGPPPPDDCRRLAGAMVWS